MLGSAHSTHRYLRRASLLGLVLAAGTSCAKRNPDFVGQGGESSSTGSAAETSVGSSNATAGATTMETQDCAPVLSSIRLTIFAENCTAADCHSGEAPAGALDLVNVDLFEDLLDVRSSTCLDWNRVIAGNPELSILYAKVAGIGTCDVQDPVDHEPLPQVELQCIANWIESIAACERCGGTECVDLDADPTNCGACDVVCPAGVACVAGACDCPNDGIACHEECVNPATDNLHCGDCDKDCQGSPCDNGECVCVGLTACDGCVDTDTDPLHCGGCNQPCDIGQECVQGRCLCAQDAVSFAVEVQPILTKHCVKNGCHAGQSPKKDLSLEEGKAYAELVGVEAVQCTDGRFRVARGAPEDSYLIHKMIGVDICAGVQMPSSGGPSDGITSAEIDLIGRWICQGALEN